MPEKSRSVPDLPSGVYRHYKGPLYLVLGYGHDANAEDLWVTNEPGAWEQYSRLGERTVVVYVGLQLDGAHTGARLAVRTAEDFLAPVCVRELCDNYGKALTDGFPRFCLNDGHGWPRFSYVGPTYEPQRGDKDA